MEGIYQRIWDLAVPYLKKGIRKDFVLHTKGVVYAMELLLKKESADESVLIPAAILHDVGWSKVPVDLQKNDDVAKKHEALRLHIEYAPTIIEDVLRKLKYDADKMSKIVDIVKAHKFQNPAEHEKRLLIDADTMSDAFREQFYSDVKSYGNTPEQLYQFRKKNDFYTKSAKVIFINELEQRRKEFKSAQN